MKNSIKYRITILTVFVLSVALGSVDSKAQQIGIKSNALYWALGTPNLGFEIVTGEHTSVGLNVAGHYKPYTLPSKLFAVEPEFRYWFNGRPMTREFIGVMGMFTSYDMKMNNFVYNGDALALGPTGGYVFSLGKKWTLALEAGVGVVVFKQKQHYEYDNYEDYYPTGYIKTNAWGYKLLPLKLGVTFTYIIK